MHTFVVFLSKRYKHCLLWSILWVPYFYGPPHITKLNFSPVNLSYINLITKLAKEPIREESKSFSPLLYKPLFGSSFNFLLGLPQFRALFSWEPEPLEQEQLFFFAMQVACGSSPARDQTHSTAVTRVSAAITPDPSPSVPQENFGTRTNFALSASGLYPPAKF